MTQTNWVSGEVIAVDKDEKYGTWYVIVLLLWLDRKNCRKVKKGLRPNGKRQTRNIIFVWKKLMIWVWFLGSLYKPTPRERYEDETETQFLAVQRRIFCGRSHCHILSTRKCVVIFVRQILSNRRMNRFSIVMLKKNLMYLCIWKLCNQNAVFFSIMWSGFMNR